MIKTRLIKLLGDSQKYILGNITFQWLNLIGQIVIVYQISQLVERLFKKNLSGEYLIYTGLIVGTVVVLKYLCDRKITYNSYLASRDVKRILRKKIYNKVLSLGTGYREYISTAELVQLSNEGVDQLETYYGKYLPQFFYSLLAPITLFIILSFVNISASLVLLLCVPLIPLSIVLVQKIAKRLISRYLDMYASLGDSFLENLQGMTTLKIYQADTAKIVEMDQEADHFRNITMKVLVMQLNSTTVMDIIAYGGAAIGMIVAILQFRQGNISLSGTLMICLLASEFFLPLRLLGSYFHIAMNGMAASDRIFKLLDIQERTKGEIELGKLNKIELKNIHFSYDQEKELFQGINLIFDGPGLYSLVGESGCGKSTIAKLLTKKLLTYQGDIYLNDCELKQVKESSLLQKVVRVTHESYLFKGTVADNLAMAKDDASAEEMEAVLAKVNLLSFIRRKDGLATLVDEEGKNLSGGQRQRLSLARALLADPDGYIFDEATSNIDIESEEMIMQVIQELAQEKMVILISHRLYNVINSKMIYMLDRGKIIETGQHKELLSLNKEYAKMFNWQQQLEKYAGGKEDE